METFTTTSMNHLGLIACIFDELEIGQIIDTLIIQEADKRNISIGQAVKSFTIIGLGFVQRRLYLASEFLSNKPVEELFGQGITSDMFTDDCLGRALDDIQKFGTTALYSAISVHACNKLGLKHKSIHMDSTSMHVDGKYNSLLTSEQVEDTIHITQGYSRDHRPDLNQLCLNLICSNTAGIPLHMQAINGNSSDKEMFAATVRDYANQLTSDYTFQYMVSDSALYVKETIVTMPSGIKWITRVPETIAEARQAIASCNKSQMLELTDNYCYKSIHSEYGGVAQRWMIVFSKDAYNRELVTLNKNISKQVDQSTRDFKKLSNKAFSCQEDARAALNDFAKKHQSVELSNYACAVEKHYSRPGKPAKNDTNYKEKYHITGDCVKNNMYQQEREKYLGMFIIATNECDSKLLTDDELLDTYKQQGTVERGFRFLKDPQFQATQIFLKKPERVEALQMVMCLLVYAALEYRLRTALSETGQTVPDQKKKPTSKPTTRWLFALFDGIHILRIEGSENTRCLNLT